MNFLVPDGGWSKWMWTLCGPESKIQEATARLMEMFTENRNRQRPQKICKDEEELSNRGKKRQQAWGKGKGKGKGKWVYYEYDDYYNDDGGA
eukprot:2819632-Karenia_brevis.AAC.1